ncbi:MAG TPA: TIGR03118 family protein [Verrucomicrobiae bacterium]|nr:TIGR03118 family protein [Verrucomicrobiae bacterium]
MKDYIGRNPIKTEKRTNNRRGLRLTAGLVAVACAPLLALADEDGGGRYVQTNLVSDQAGMALLQDTNLVNAWGISAGPATPFWVSDNGSGLSTLYAVTYDSSGVVQVAKQGLEVAIPGEGTPTGQLFDGTGSFKGDIFIFASEDGTISGWRGSLGTSAEVLVPGGSAVYKGIALTTTMHGPTLLAANFANGTLDEFDTNLVMFGQLKDMRAPKGYAPFNVQNLNGMVFVTFAKQNEAKHDDVPGRGHGLIDILDPMTGKFHRFATGSAAGGHLHEINSPWGLAIAPSGFGAKEDKLLVGNFGSGTIMAFEADGDLQGLLRDVNGGPIVIDGLWGLKFGNDGKGGRSQTLYFSAGPNGESHGLFGALDPAAAQNNHDGGDNHDGRDGGNGDNRDGHHGDRN